MDILIDVRTREEFIKGYVNGAINIPLYGLNLHLDFLKDKNVAIYCTTGRRAMLAGKKLREMGIDISVIPPEEVDEYEWTSRDMVCAANYVLVKPGLEEGFEAAVKELRKATDEISGFLGSTLLKVSGISCVGSGLTGDCEDFEVKPAKYLILTYWTSKEVHEESHAHPISIKAFIKLVKYLARMPYEKFYEIL